MARSVVLVLTVVLIHSPTLVLCDDDDSFSRNGTRLIQDSLVKNDTFPYVALFEYIGSLSFFDSFFCDGTLATLDSFCPIDTINPMDSF